MNPAYYVCNRYIPVLVESSLISVSVDTFCESQRASLYLLYVPIGHDEILHEQARRQLMRTSYVHIILHTGKKSVCIRRQMYPMYPSRHTGQQPHSKVHGPWMNQT